MSEYYIGVDLGGTYTKTGILRVQDGSTEVYGFTEAPTPTDSRDALIDSIVEAVRRMLKDHDLPTSACSGLGIGAPGPLNRARGVILHLPNIPGMSNLPLRDRIGDALGIPAVLENDANAAAMGEYLFGAGRDVQSMIMLTLGTGVGGGIIVDGQILHGAHDIAGEVGHIIVQPGGRLCNCGQHGCLEQYASATFLAKHAEDEVKAGRKSLLAKTLAKKGSIDAADVNEARKGGDALATEAWDTAVYHLAIGCVTLERMLDCELIVLAGGLVNAGADLLGPLQAYYRELDWKLSDQMSPLAIATLGSRAGVHGAAGVAWQTFGMQA